MTPPVLLACSANTSHLINENVKRQQPFVTLILWCCCDNVYLYEEKAMERNVTTYSLDRGLQSDAKKHTTSTQLNAQKDRRPTVVKSRPATRNLSNSMSSAFTHLGENIVQQTAPPQRLAIES